MVVDIMDEDEWEANLAFVAGLLWRFFLVAIPLIWAIRQAWG